MAEIPRRILLNRQAVTLLDEGRSAKDVYEQLRHKGAHAAGGAGTLVSPDRELLNTLRHVAGWDPSQKGGPLGGADWGPC